MPVKISARSGRVSTRLRTLAVNGAVAAAAAAAALLLAELLLPRIVTLEQATLEYDELLGFRGRPDLSIPWTREVEGPPRVVTTNSRGFHDHERAPRPAPGSRRIILLGDSFLEAYQVDIEANFSQRLARGLSRRAAGEYEAVNWGVHGYGLGSHFLAVRERVADWNPDCVVLVLFLGNDLQDNFAPLASASVPRFEMAGGELTFLPAPPYSPRSWLRDNVLARSAVARLAWKYAVKTNPGIAALARDAGMIATPDLARSEAHLQDMIAVAGPLLEGIAGHLRQREIGLFVYLIPDPLLLQDAIDIRRYRRDPGAPRPVFRRDRERIETGILKHLEELQVEYAYPRELFIEQIERGNAIYRGGYGHFTALGHELSARLLADGLAASRFVRTDPGTS